MRAHQSAQDRLHPGRLGPVVLVVLAVDVVHDLGERVQRRLAMYLGWLVDGVLGATVVGIAFVLPSLLIVLVLAADTPEPVGFRCSGRCFTAWGPR